MLVQTFWMTPILSPSEDQNINASENRNHALRRIPESLSNIGHITLPVLSHACRGICRRPAGRCLFPSEAWRPGREPCRAGIVATRSRRPASHGPLATTRKNIY